MTRIAHNIAALNSWRNLSKAAMNLGASMERLSSGFRINRASDDPAGLVLSEKLRAQVTGLNQGVRNTQDAISMIQTAEGALEEMHRLLNDMRALALHSANTGVVDAASVAADQAQIDEAVDSLNRIANNTSFADKSLLDGSTGNRATVVNSTALASVTAGATAPSGTNLVATIVTTAATQAVLTGNVNVSSGPAANGTINVNGVNINLLDAETQAQTVATINSALTAAGVNVTASISTNFIRFTHNSYGADYTVSVNDASGILFSTAFSTDAGDNVAGTINGEAATGRGLTLTANAGTAYAGTAVTFTTAATATTYSNAFSVTQGDFTFQIGSDAGDSITSNITDMRANKLGTTAGGATGLNAIKTGGTYTLAANATGALAVIDEAIADVSDERSKLGALQKYVLETKINSLQVAAENVQASESRVRDMDMAKGVSEFQAWQIQQQAATSMLAQANASVQGILQLLQG